MKEKFWLCKRGRIFYLCDSETQKRTSLNTRDPQEAQRLLAARIETLGKPALGLAMARAYLASYDDTQVRAQARGIRPRPTRESDRRFDGLGNRAVIH